MNLKAILKEAKESLKTAQTPIEVNFFKLKIFSHF